MRKRSIMTTSRLHRWHRVLSVFLAFDLVIAPIAPALAQITPLADEPIGFTPLAPPNLMLTVDDSTSMLADYLPDYVIGSVPGSSPLMGGFCRDATGTMSVACGFAGDWGSPGYIYTAPNVPFGSTANVSYATGSPAYTISNIPDRQRAWPAPAHSNALNRLYYDPSITYSPPLKYDGTPYPEQNAVNTTNWTKVVADPWATKALQRTVNLTTNVNVGMWCNSDWPNNTEWNPAASGGGECRINGTDYSTLATNKATAEYQYPWQKQSGADDIKYFWRNSATATSGTWTKSLWCDVQSGDDANNPKNPYRPRTCSTSTTTTWTCPAGQKYSPPKSQPQTCVQTGTTTGCLASTTTYDPPGCNTNPKYGSPGPCVGPECLVCKSSSTCTSTGVNGKTGQCRLTSTKTGGSGAACNCSGATCTLPSCSAYTEPGALGTCSGGATPTKVDTKTSSCSFASLNCNTVLWDPVAGAPGTTKLVDDANGKGLFCRRNNLSYADGTPSNPFNYSASHAKYKSQVTGSCPTVPYMAGIRRHYWKTSVEWCTTKITTNNDKWRGFGLGGTCQPEHDLAHPYPRFYKYGVRTSDPEYLDNYTYPAFERVDLDPARTAYTHQWYRNGLLQTITRTYAQEITNYANWFAYYRTRIQAAKTTISQNFTFLDDAYRVGFQTLNDPSTSFQNILPFEATSGGQKAQWYDKLFGIQIAMGQQTPTMDALVRIGELYKTGSMPGVSALDPITLSCQKNYHMLFTDGITNQPALPGTTVGNVDNMVPALPVPLFVSPPIVAGSAWPDLYRENTAASMSNTMADYAMHYWVTDLRPTMTNNVITGRDPATWQHVNFAALSLGAEGVLAGASPATTEAQIATGAIKWPSPTPSQFQPDATGVEDLWHAAVNSRGRFVNAKTSQQLGRGIAGILMDITSPSGSGAGASFGNPNISVDNKYTYVTEFEQGWGGNVRKLEVDPTSLATVGLVWDAKTQLIAQTTPSVGHPTPWYTRRRIVTMNEAGTVVPFLLTNLGTTQRTTLGADTTSQLNVVEYIRGRRSMEGEDEGQFRVRPSPLGDIVDSQALLVGSTGAPTNDFWSYLEANDPGYAAFKTSQATRAGRVYVGANDGMFHVFDDATGEEVWAFIPRDFYRSAPPVSNDKAGLVGLTYQPGGLPIYDHRFYVNATPRIVDANLGSWKTLVVFGLGKGGKSYYAVDASNPSSVTTEANAATKVLWQFTNADLGYTFGRATIVKTRAHGWTVIVPSGYNNTSGEGKIFVLRASDGTLLKTMATGVGTPTSPSGLAQIAGYTKDYRNQLVEQVYGGDLLGNVWRFDLSDADASAWKVERLARLTDASGNPQPITMAPRIDVDITNGVDRWVFVGTGRLLHIDDLDDTQQQTMYAIRDGTYDKPGVITGALTRDDLDGVSGASGLGAGVIAEKGWYDDLATGQRIVKPPVPAVGVIAYIATSQPTDPCETGLPATIFARKFGSGETALEVGGVPVESIYEPAGAASLEMIATKPAGCTDGCIPEIKLAIITSSTVQLISHKVNLPGITGERRMSWWPLFNNQ